MVDLLADRRDIELNYSIKSIVSKPLEKLRYSTRIDGNSIATNYFESVELNSTDNVVLEDNSISYPFNDRRKLDPQLFKVSRNLRYISDYSKVLLSVFSGRNRHNESVPLFYKQKKEAGKQIVGVEIRVISNHTNDDVINYGYSIINGELYYNYENEFNELTGEYRLYFLTISYSDTDSETTIINPVPAIPKATYNNESEIRYSFIRRVAGYEYRVLLPENQTLAQFLCTTKTNNNLYIKELEANSIYLKKPENQSIENEWVPEIVAGEVIKVTGENVFRYRVPEFYNQPFDGLTGSLNVFNKDCYVVTEKVVKLPYKGILEDKLKIYQYDLNEALLNNGASLSLSSIDEHGGFVVLQEQLNFGQDYILRANFNYKTETLFYRQLNLNPYLNKEAVSEKYHFYVKPNVDDNAIQVIKDKYLDSENIDVNWLYLGAIFYDDTSYIEDSFSFKLDENERFFSLEEALDENPYILQSKLGYGTKGQILQRNKTIVLTLPKELETSSFYTKEDLYTLFKRKLKISTNLILQFKDEEPQLKFKDFSSDKVTIECTWEGPGGYALYRASNEDMQDQIFRGIKDIPSLDEPYIFDFTDDDVVPGNKYWYKISYNGVMSEKTYGIKVELDNG